jgi:PIN domain nuclease of toxin-antitoxin system
VEISTKQRLGQLPQADGIVSTYTRNLHRLRAVELPVTAEHALLAGRLDWDHSDPFDRMLAAQAMIESLTLVTRDVAFASLPGIRTLW